MYHPGKTSVIAAEQSWDT